MDKKINEYDYLNHHYDGISQDQFKNLIAFLVVLLNENVMTLTMVSPDYILEKYSKYVGDITNISDDKNYLSGVHPILYKDFIVKYHKYWGIPKNWKLKDLLKII